MNIPQAALQKEERGGILNIIQLSTGKYWKLLVLSFLGCL